MSKVRTITQLNMPLLNTEGAINRSKSFFSRYPSFTIMKKESILISSGRLTVLGIAGIIESSNGGGEIVSNLAVLAQCECGNKVITQLKSIRQGKIVSCGCYHRETSSVNGRKNAKAYRESTFFNEDNSILRSVQIESQMKAHDIEFQSNTNFPIEFIRKRYYNYVTNAYKVGRVFELTRQEVTKLVTSPCHYCGKIEEKANGIDRVNNEVGYILSNVVACCKACNYMKSVYTQFFFLDHVQKIANHQNMVTNPDLGNRA